MRDTRQILRLESPCLRLEDTHQPRSQGLSCFRPPGKMRDPGNEVDGCSIAKQDNLLAEEAAQHFSRNNSDFVSFIIE